jgi:hypothetical protein
MGTDLVGALAANDITIETGQWGISRWLFSPFAIKGQVA